MTPSTCPAYCYEINGVCSSLSVPDPFFFFFFPLRESKERGNRTVCGST